MRPKEWIKRGDAAVVTQNQGTYLLGELSPTLISRLRSKPLKKCGLKADRSANDVPHADPTTALQLERRAA